MKHWELLSLLHLGIMIGHGAAREDDVAMWAKDLATLSNWTGVNVSRPLFIARFEHQGISVRGVAVKQFVRRGTEVISMLLSSTVRQKVKKNNPNSFPLRFSGPNNTYERVGLLIAEKQVELQPSDPVFDSVNFRPVDEWYRAYIRLLPTLEEMREEGLPMVQGNEEMARYAKVRQLASMTKILAKQWNDVGLHMDSYNAALKLSNNKKEEHDPLTFEDALWGITATGSRFFSFQDCGPSSVPILNLINHAEKPNARAQCADGVVKLVAARDIYPSEEITISYSSKDSPFMHMFAHYGILTWAKIGTLPDEACKMFKEDLRSQKIGPKSKMLMARHVYKMFEKACPADATTTTTTTKANPDPSNEL